MSDEATPTPEEEVVAEIVEVVDVEEVAAEAEAVVEEVVAEETEVVAEAVVEEAAVEETEVVAEAAVEEAAAEVTAEATEVVAEAEAVVEEAAAEKAPAYPLTINMVPPEYVPQVRRGRNRRINIDINLKDVHYKNIPLLSRFLDPFGRILSRRKTKVSAKVQRRAVTAIKQARHLSLLPYTGDHTRLTRRKRR